MGLTQITIVYFLNALYFLQMTEKLYFIMNKI